MKVLIKIAKVFDINYTALLEGVEDDLELGVLIGRLRCFVPLCFECLHLLAVLFDLCCKVRGADFHCSSQNCVVTALLGVRVHTPQHFLRFFAELRNAKSTPAFLPVFGPGK